MKLRVGTMRTSQVQRTRQRREHLSKKMMLVSLDNKAFFWKVTVA